MVMPLVFILFIRAEYWMSSASAAFLILQSLASLSKPPINKLYPGFEFLIFVALALLGSQSVTDMKLINLYFTLLDLLLVVCCVAGSSFYRFFWLGNKNSGIYFAAMMSMFATLGHDTFYQFGLISDVIILSHADTIEVVLCVGTLYFSMATQSRSQLAANNLILEKEQWQSQAMLRVHSELHDGVLNYLSIVNILS